MRIEKIKAKYRGKEFEAEVAFPESFEEMMALPHHEIFTDFLLGYRMRMKSEVCGVRKRKKRIVKLNLEALSPEQLEALSQAGILRA